MKGYKGFDKNLQCRGKQYEIGQEYVEDKAEICQVGLHSCLNPLDVLNYYPLKDGNKYAEVEIGGDISQKENEDSKISSTKLKIIAQISIKDMVSAAIKFIFEKSKIVQSGNSAHAATSGDYAHAVTSGNSAHAATSGDYANAATSGNSAHAATSGDYAHVATSGNYAHAATSGYSAHAATSGYYANAATSGNYANAATSGYSAHAATSGNNCISAAVGRNSCAKAALNGWIVLSEYDSDYKVICVKTAKVDGKKIKADTWYKLENKKFVEVSE